MSAEAVHIPQVLKVGWLYKQIELPGSDATWKKVYCAKWPEELEWYKNDQLKTTEPLGSIISTKAAHEKDIVAKPDQTIGDIESCQKEVTDRKFTFSLSVATIDPGTKQHQIVKHYFSGTNALERDQWIAVMSGVNMDLSDCHGFQVKLIHATDLAAKDSNGKSDPFCLIVDSTGFKHKTSVIR